jgi:hypothetical protein
MPVYVAEISGRGIAAFDAIDDAEAAKTRLTDRAFLRDLIVLQNHGKPLWDGVSQIGLRSASPEEAVKWQAGMTVDGQDRFVFLVPVVDPSEKWLDEDDDHIDKDRVADDHDRD